MASINKEPNGHSQAVAAKHYLRATDADYDRAATEAVQNPVQQPRRNERQRPAARKPRNEKGRETRPSSTCCDSLRQ